jgi:Uma2 family endonuclease
MEITKLSQLDLNETYSYFDYLNWKFQERVELYKGKIFEMSPAPASRHQRLLGKVNYPIYSFLEEKNCEVFQAPFDVRLKRNTDDKKNITVVQPDICVICDPEKIDERGCNGAPDLVVEILSPGNSKKEMKLKFDLYEEAGVLEYWIVDPEKEIVLQYVLENGQYTNHRPLTSDDILNSKVLEGFKLDLSKVF